MGIGVTDQLFHLNRFIYLFFSWPVSSLTVVSTMDIGFCLKLWLSLTTMSSVILKRFLLVHLRYALSREHRRRHHPEVITIFGFLHDSISVNFHKRWIKRNGWFHHGVVFPFRTKFKIFDSLCCHTNQVTGFRVFSADIPSSLSIDIRNWAMGSDMSG